MATTKDDPAGALLVVVNGPIGGGKSTVADMLRGLGAHVINADRLGHLVLEPGAEAHGAVAAAWPDVVVDGAIDRRRLAGIVFADPDELAALERLTHPHIAARIREAVAAVLDADAATTPPVVVLEMPLLSPPEGATGPRADGSGGWHTITVIAGEDVRRERAVARGMEPDDAGRRIRAQPPAEDWEAAADTVIRNDGDLDDLRRRVEEWWVRHVA
jgi:dephospho-CoA kinase